MKKYIQFTKESLSKLAKDRDFYFANGREARIDYANLTCCNLSQIRKASYLLAENDERLKSQIKANNFTGMLLLGFMEISEDEVFTIGYDEEEEEEMEEMEEMEVMEVMEVLSEINIRIENIIVADLKNAGCDNGNYPDALIVYSYNDGQSLGSIKTTTCRCQNGCNGTSRLVSAGVVFETLEALEDYIS